MCLLDVNEAATQIPPRQAVVTVSKNLMMIFFIFVVNLVVEPFHKHIP